MSPAGPSPQIAFVGIKPWLTSLLLILIFNSFSKKLFIKNNIILRNPVATRPWQHVLEPLSGYLLLGSKLLNKKLKKGIEVVEDVNDALKKVTTLNKIQVKNKLKYGRNIYKKYISPNSFYKFIKANLND